MERVLRCYRLADPVQKAAGEQVEPAKEAEEAAPAAEVAEKPAAAAEPESQ